MAWTFELCSHRTSHLCCAACTSKGALVKSVIYITLSECLFAVGGFRGHCVAELRLPLALRANAGAVLRPDATEAHDGGIVRRL